MTRETIEGFNRHDNSDDDHGTLHDLGEPPVTVRKEAVDHPAHYNEHPSGVEAIDIIEHMSFNVGNAVKYLWRADHKGAPIEDLKKAAWYIQREIERRTQPFTMRKGPKQRDGD